jgi:putative tryptophan/tyrosine transport system substrate-binding protein
VPVLRSVFAVIIVLAILAPSLAEAYQVLLLLSSRDRVYDQAVSGFRRGRDFSERVVVLSDYREADLNRAIREDRPQVIVAVGDRAVAAVRKNRQVPVVSLMALSLHRLSGTSPTFTGVDFLIRPERYLAILSAMKKTRVGVLYDPDRSAEYLRQARQAAARFGIELVPRVVKSPKEVIGKLEHLKGEVDAVWMIPDASAVDNASAEAYFLFSLGEQVPVISFSRSHLQLGAAVVLEADQEEMGRQAGEMTAEILNGKPVSELPVATPRKSLLRVNQGILKRFHIFLDGIAKLPGFSKE